MEFDVLVEIPKGQRNKYEVDKASGRIRPDTWSTSYLFRCPLGISTSTSNSMEASSLTMAAGRAAVRGFGAIG